MAKRWQAFGPLISLSLGCGTADGDATAATTGEADVGSSSSESEADESESGQPAECGNGIVEAPEACDDGENLGQYGGCAADCSELGPRCGDGEVQGEESCDDANEVDGDGCNLDCQASGRLVWSLSLDPAFRIESFEAEPDGWLIGGREGQLGRVSRDGMWLGQETIDIPSSYLTDISRLELAEDGRLLICAGDSFLRLLDADRAPVWTRPLELADELVAGTAFLDDGSFLVVSQASPFAEIGIRQFGPDGEEQWATTLHVDRPEGSLRQPRGLFALEGGRALLAITDFEGNDWSVVGLVEPGEGVTEAQLGDGYITAFSATPDAEFVVLHRYAVLSSETYREEQRILRYGGDGRPRWTKELGLESTGELVTSLALDRSGGLVVIRLIDDPSGERNYDYELEKFGVDGASLWAHDLDELVAACGVPRGLDIATDGRILVSCLLENEENSPMSLLEVSP